MNFTRAIASGLFVIAMALSVWAQKEEQLNPSYSPDGSSLAFYSDQGLYLWEHGATKPRLLVKNGNAPSWSPDGRRIVFIHESPDFPFSVWVLDLDSGNKERLTEKDVGAFSPSFSPDGTKVVYSQPQSENVSQIVVRDLATGDSEALSDERMFAESPAWSPDGARIAFIVRRKSYSNDIAELDLNTKKLTLLKSTTGRPTKPSYSPYGDTIMYSAWNKTSVDVEYQHHGLTETITPGDGKYFMGTWHPSGNWIVVSSDRGGKGFKLYKISFDGLKKITPFNPLTDLTPPPAKKPN